VKEKLSQKNMFGCSCENSSTKLN